MIYKIQKLCTCAIVSDIILIPKTLNLLFHLFSYIIMGIYIIFKQFEQNT